MDLVLPNMVITYGCFPRRVVRATAHFLSQVLAQETSTRFLPNSMGRRGEICREDLRSRLRNVVRHILASLLILYQPAMDWASGLKRRAHIA
jgi:hypothetical protein